MSKELLGGYRAGKCFRQKKEFEQNYGKNSIQSVVERRTLMIRIEIGCFKCQMMECLAGKR